MMVLEAVLFAALSPFFVVAIQAVLFRVKLGKSPQSVTILAMLLGYLPALLVASLLFGSQWGFTSALYAFLLYSFVAYTYFHVFNMSETSRRIRMLQAIDRRGVDTVEKLHAIYNDDEMTRVRLDRLVALGQIELKDGVYFARGKMFSRTGKLLYGVSLVLGTPWKSIERFNARFKTGLKEMPKA
jgi:hypothetical protein